MGQDMIVDILITVFLSPLVFTLGVIVAVTMFNIFLKILSKLKGK